jgi:hypothetical protein
MAALKGAFINIGAGLLGGLPSIVVFQFNPERVTRTPTAAQPPTTCTGGQSDSTLQVCKPPERISFQLRVDATDQLAESNPLAASSGVLPTLSALELLMVPKSSLTLNLASLVGLGGGGSKDNPYTFPPFQTPMVLFFWGPFRILPVFVTSMTIEETLYNTVLVPVRAEVSVDLQVLTDNQIDPSMTLARGAYDYSQGVKEVMAALNLANAVEFGGGAAISLSF